MLVENDAIIIAKGVFLGFSPLALAIILLIQARAWERKESGFLPLLAWPTRYVVLVIWFAAAGTISTSF